MKLPMLGVWRRAPAGTSGGNLEQLRRLVHADGAWYVTGDGQTAGSIGAVAPWTRLEDPIRHCAATRIPDLTDSAILVPDPGAGAVLVLVRCRRKSFRPRDLSRAIAWLHQHRPDGAAEPLIVGLRTARHL